MRLCMVFSAIAVIGTVATAFADYTFTKADIKNRGWYATGVKDGSYYVQVELQGEFANMALYHEGEPLDFTVAGPWEKRDGQLRVVTQAGPVEVKDGDFFFGVTGKVVHRNNDTRPEVL